MTQEEGKGMNERLCESSGCFTAEDGYPDVGMVAIWGGKEHQERGVAVDSVAAWRTFRDDIKAGKYDHIGEVS
jgi:hypothetical protein